MKSVNDGESKKVYVVKIKMSFFVKGVKKSKIWFKDGVKSFDD